MEYDLSLFFIALLLASGLAAGFVNTIAGGGGFLTLSVLLLMGIPADVANGTNRVSVSAQSLEGVRGFHRHGALDIPAILPILAPTVSGSVIGTLLASYMPVELLRPALLIVMITMATVMMIRPRLMTPAAEEIPKRLAESPGGWAALFAAGLYGGFIQGGVGFLLLFALVGVMRYSLVQGNALKLVCTFIFGAVALAIFAIRGQVLWIPGLVITVGTLIGVRYSVNFAVRAKTETLRNVLLLAVIGACVAAFFR